MREHAPTGSTFSPTVVGGLRAGAGRVEATGATGPARTAAPRRRPTSFHAIGKLVSADLLIGELDRHSDVPLHTQVYAGLRDSILDGRLRPGASMPSTRDLPTVLGVSRNTVLAAYDQLQSEGFIEPRVGSGTYVAESIPDKYLRSRAAVTPMPVAARESADGPPRLSTRGQRMIAARPFQKAFWRRPETFYPGIPDYELLPLETWRKLGSKILAQPRRTYLGYGHPGGFGALRMVIAEYLAASRGVRCRPEQVIIVSGSQQGIDLTTRVLVDEGEDIWMEDPGYVGARSVFRAGGANVVPVSVDRDGLIVSDGINRAPHARLAYVTPSHQYPLGHLMSDGRRGELIDWATANQSWIIEDDYDSEIRYSGRPAPALQGMAGGSDRVIYIGTFSKVLFPSLRLGYMVVPPNLVDAFLAARSLSDRHQSTLDQAVLADFISEGHFVRHLRRCRMAYAERQECMLDRLAHETPGLIEVSADPAGMSLIGWLPPEVSDLHLAERLAAEGIYAPPLSYFSMKDQPRGALVLGYTGFAPHRITFSARKLGATVRDVVGPHRQAPAPVAPSGPASPGTADQRRVVTSIEKFRRQA